VFPQASGELVIPRLQFDATLGGSSWFDRFGSAGKRVRLRSQEQRIRVLPPEPGAGAWLPARLLTVVETWDRSPNELRIGESVTRTLTLTANGLTAAQLPALPTTAVDGLRLYPDKPELSDETADDGISGTRIERSAVIPQRAGDLQLPELRLRWWDTINRRFEEAVVPGRTIHVQGTKASEPPAAPATASRAEAGTDAATPVPASTPEPGAALRAWQAACAVLAALAVFSMLQWRRATHGARASARAPTTRTKLEEAERFSELHSACERNEAAAVPGLLLAWSRSALLAPAVRSLADLPGRLRSPDLQTLLNALQASRYAGATVAWDGAPLAACLVAIRSQLAVQRTRGPDAALPPLYPRDAGNALSG
jgi:hypothetical protein